MSSAEYASSAIAVVIEIMRRHLPEEAITTARNGREVLRTHIPHDPGCCGQGPNVDLLRFAEDLAVMLAAG